MGASTLTWRDPLTVSHSSARSRSFLPDTAASFFSTKSRDTNTMKLHACLDAPLGPRNPSCTRQSCESGNYYCPGGTCGAHTCLVICQVDQIVAVFPLR